MGMVLMTDPITGKVGFFAPNGSGGGMHDPAASRNAPLDDPFDYFGSLKLHSDCDMFEVAFSGTKTIAHAAVAAISAPSGLGVAYGADAGGDDNLLITHGLGYAPLCIVAVGSNILWPGMPVQTLTDGSGGARYATAYADTTDLRLATLATIGSTLLPGESLTYSYLVFKAPPAASGSVLFEWEPSTGILSFGLGKVSTDKQYLQIVSGGSPLAISFGETIDIHNGAPKAWNPDGTTYAPVPSGLKGYLVLNSHGTIYTSILGAGMAYNGSATGPAASLEVQAP